MRNFDPRKAHLIASGVVLGIVVAITSGAIADLNRTPSLTSPSPSTDPQIPTITDEDLQAPIVTPALVEDAARRTAVVDAVASVAPAVVSITTETPSQDPFSHFYGPSTSESEGSGVVIESDGVVLTNAHVVQRAHRITATMSDGQTYSAEIIGMAPELDLAVLRLQGATELSSVTIGSSSDLMLGEPVIAIGNPFGLGHTVTTGVISHPSRPLSTDERVYQDFIQTDASINPGNSGGPLLNAHGHLIGINTSIRANAEGIGFAIPVDRAIKVARDLVDHGMVQIPWLGIDLKDVRLRAGRSSVIATQVSAIHPEGPAQSSGLQVGDVIRVIDDREIQGRADLNAWLAAFQPGTNVELTGLRGSKSFEVTIQTSSLPDALVSRMLQDGLGVQLRDGQNAVQILQMRPNSELSRYGIRPGDWIIGVDGHTIQTTKDLKNALAAVKSAHRRSIMLTIQRGRSVGRIQIEI